MNKILSPIDWSASVRDFRLAVSILKDQTEDAISTMKQIGKRGELVHEIAYHQWPLFNAFREEPLFHKAYEEIFGIPFLFESREKCGRGSIQAREIQRANTEPPTLKSNRFCRVSEKVAAPRKRRVRPTPPTDTSHIE